MARKKILIVEDDVLISEQLKKIVLEFDYDVVGIAYDYDSAVKMLNAESVDLAILDIRMQGEEQGFKIASYIKDTISIPYFFLTSHSDPNTIERAGELNPSGYITKPFTKEQVFTTLKMTMSLKPKQNHILIKDGLTNQKVAVNDILWIHAEGVYIELQTKQKKLVVRTSLKSFLEEYKIDGLVRTHRSYLVNIKNASSLSNAAINVEGTKIPIARSNKQEVHDAFNQQVNSI